MLSVVGAIVIILIVFAIYVNLPDDAAAFITLLVALCAMLYVGVRVARSLSPTTFFERVGAVAIALVAAFFVFEFFNMIWEIFHGH